MRKIGKILWFILFGLLGGLAYFFCSIACFVSLIGIPFGIAFFRLAKLIFSPFGKSVSTSFKAHPVGNIIWLLVGGVEMALAFAVLGVIFCITLIGIPYGKQFFKLAKLCVAPFGAHVA